MKINENRMREYTTAHDVHEINRPTDYTFNVGEVDLAGYSAGDKLTFSASVVMEDIVFAENAPSKYLRIQGEGDITGWGDGSLPPVETYAVKEGTYLLRWEGTIEVQNSHLRNTKWEIIIRIDGVQSGKVKPLTIKAELGEEATMYIPHAATLTQEQQSILPPWGGVWRKVDSF